MDPILEKPIDQQDAYRLIRGTFHRLIPKDADHPEGYVMVERGEIFYPTGAELRTYRDHLEGPIQPGEVKATPAENIDTLAGRELEKSMPAIRDAVRQADERMLEALQRVEAQRSPAPRVKVMEMIIRRLKNFQPA